MPDLIEYFLETSNDENLPFLESIEAMSRSHRDDSRCSDPTSFSDFSFMSNNFVSNYEETSTYTDCDLNILVDPKTGEEWSPIDPLSSSTGVHFHDDEAIDIKLENSSPTVSVVNIKEEDNPKERVVLIQFSPSYVKSETHPLKQPKATLPTTNHKSHPINIPQRSSPPNTSSSTATKSSNKHKPDKPPYSYSLLIAMALKDSAKGFLPVSDIYNYIINRFPYFKTAPDGWKNSIRHNLSLNKSFQKLETPSLNGSQRKACLWGLSDGKMSRFDEEIAKCSKKADHPSKLITDKFLEDDLLLGEELSPPLSIPLCQPSPPTPTPHKDLTYYRVVKFPKNELLFDDLLDHNDFRSLSIPVNNNNNNFNNNNNNFNNNNFNNNNFNNNNNNNQRSAFRTIIANDSPLSLKTVQASA